MNRASKLIFGLITATFLACGGSSSGVDGSKELKDLTTEEKRALCQLGVDEFGIGQTECSDGLTVSTRPVDECAMDDLSSVSCTVSVFEDCVNSAGGDRCKLTSTPECGAYIACSLRGS